MSDSKFESEEKVQDVAQQTSELKENTQNDNNDEEMSDEGNISLSNRILIFNHKIFNIFDFR